MHVCAHDMYVGKYVCAHACMYMEITGPPWVSAFTFYVVLRQVPSFASVYFTLAGLTAFGFSSLFPPVVIGVLGIQICDIASGFTWVLGNLTLVLMPLGQVFYTHSYLSAIPSLSVLSAFCTIVIC